MNHDINACFFKLFNRFVVNAQIISTANISCAFFIYRLKPKLNKNRFNFVDFVKKFDNIFAEAVGSCCYRKCDNIRVIQRLIIFFSQHFCRRICVCKSLKISNVFAVFYFLFNSFFAAFDLLGYAFTAFFRKISAPAFRTENTTPRVNFSVTVGAGETCV